MYFNIFLLFKDDTYDSDMEYPDDELLKILRKQRSQYEEKLR